jgi:hypothetical protein
MHIRTHEPAERQHLLTLREYVMATGAAWESLMIDMAKNKADPLIARQAAECVRMAKNAPKTRVSLRF